MSKNTVNALAISVIATTAASYYYYRSNSSKAKNTYLFVGDIGGTNTRLAIYSANSLPGTEPLFSNTYKNEEFIKDDTKTFEHEIFSPFLSGCDIEWDRNTELIACFAVAGPVKNNTATMTNLGIGSEVQISGDKIMKNSHGLLHYIKRCKIVNDFVGQGYGMLDLDVDTDLEELVPGSKILIKENASGVKACVGAGTGLGECFLTASTLHPDDGHECYPSEGGHVDFAAHDQYGGDELEGRLAKALMKKFDQLHRISVERIVSGRGLANIFEFLCDDENYKSKVRPYVKSQFDAAGDEQGKIVGMNAQGEDPCPVCVKAMRIMVSTYGAEAGNCALKFIPTGGLYITGGITPKIMNYIRGENSPFIKAYKDKGRLGSVLKTVPLVALTEKAAESDDLGLRGAKVCAYREYKKM